LFAIEGLDPGHRILHQLVQATALER
jgi:hypothetical protein